MSQTDCDAPAAGPLQPARRLSRRCWTMSYGTACLVLLLSIGCPAIHPGGQGSSANVKATTTASTAGESLQWRWLAYGGQIGDFDGDGDQEMLRTSQFKEDPSGLIEADGSTTSLPAIGMRFVEFTAWDFDHNGRDEIVVNAADIERLAEEEQPGGTDYATTGQACYPIYNSAGESKGILKTGLSGFCQTLTADLTGDGLNELLVYAVKPSGATKLGELVAYQNLAAPVWKAQVNIVVWGDSHIPLLAGDIDGDGSAEVVATAGVKPDVLMYGINQAPIQLPQWPAEVYPSTLANVDGDASCEIVAFPEGIYWPATGKWTQFKLPPEFDLAGKVPSWT